MSLSPSLPLIALGLLALAGPVRANGLADFLGAESFALQKLWDGPGGTSVVVARDGSVLAFEGTRGNRVLRSTDGGASWSTPITIGSDALDGNVLVDEVSGNVLYVNPAAGALWRSTNHGQSWQKETITIAPDGLGSRGLDVRHMQPGLTLGKVPGPPYGSDQRGRLIMPARILGPENSDAPDWRIYHSATALFSDDGGASWATSIPFPIMGAADGAIAELTYDGLVFSAREQITRGNRYLGRSPDNGLHWVAADRNADIPDGPRGSSSGLMGGLIRLPVAGYDILLYSNVDTDAGSRPAEFAGDSTDGCERMTVWASFDGGRTWPVKRLVYDGPAGISNLAAGRAGTAGAGKIFLLFEGGPDSRNSAVQLATFNLSWLLDGRDIDDYLVPLVDPDPVPTRYWTGEGNRFGGQENAWSSVSYDSAGFPVYSPGLSSGDTFRFSYDLTRMTGSTATVRMNRDDVTMVSLRLAGTGAAGLTFSNVDNNGSGLRLAGPIQVLSGVHIFEAPAPGRTITLTADSTWTIADGASLQFYHVLAGPHGFTKSGPGTLIIAGSQLHTGETIIGEGTFAVGSTPASLAGDLTFSPGAKFRFGAPQSLTVGGTITFEEEFGIADLDNLDGTTAPGTYTLISGDVKTAHLLNVGIHRASPIGPGRWAYFEKGEGLRVTVVDSIPPLRPLALAWAGLEEGRPLLRVDGPPDARIVVQVSTNLVQWHNLETIIVPDPPALYTDSESPMSSSIFYRAFLTP
jgi:sialidase-1